MGTEGLRQMKGTPEDTHGLEGGLQPNRISYKSHFEIKEKLKDKPIKLPEENIGEKSS